MARMNTDALAATERNGSKDFEPRTRCGPPPLCASTSGGATARRVNVDWRRCRKLPRRRVVKLHDAVLQPVKVRVRVAGRIPAGVQVRHVAVAIVRGACDVAA